MNYENDLDSIKKIKDAFVASVEQLSASEPSMFENGRFGVWATSALVDLLCLSAKSIGLEKDMVLAAIEENWDSTTKSDSVLN
jgi:hypothetical protein